MKDVLIASDSATVREEVAAVLSSRDYTVRYVTSGAAVRPAIVDRAPDLLVCDFQIGSMGGVAVTLDARLEESGGRIDHVPVLLLLDRRADVFLARRSDADGFLVKPLDPIRLRRAVAAVIDGGRFADDSYRPAESAAAV
ncbi:MAG TPA: response regulator [Acidimicrobiales bacterium]|nr:response regulator [Acidimicrobiales bacterium]